MIPFDDAPSVMGGSLRLLVLKLNLQYIGRSIGLLMFASETPSMTNSTQQHAFHVHTDDANNLMMLSLIGRFDEQDGMQLEEGIREKLHKLSRGFGLLNDMTLLKEMTAGGNSSHQKIMDMCNAAGVKKIARVFRDETTDTGFNVMSAFHYDWEVGIRRFETVSQALNYLLNK